LVCFLVGFETEHATGCEPVADCCEVFVDESLNPVGGLHRVFGRSASPDGFADGFLDVDDADLTHGNRLRDDF